MDWNGNPKPQLVSKTDNNNLASFLYNCNFDHSPGIEMRYQVGGQVTGQHGVMPVMEMEINNSEMINASNGNYIQEMRKKRLTSEQLDSLESSFQEDIKLDPDRKTRLAKELGLQPRQIAVWFQNRRARWKSKQLERLYDALKQEFDHVSREKQRLQEEVIALRSIVRQQASKKQGSTTINYTEMSGEETVESTSQNRIIPSDNYVMNIVDDYNPGNVIPTSSNYWPILPPYPSNI